MPSSCQSLLSSIAERSEIYDSLDLAPAHLRVVGKDRPNQAKRADVAVVSDDKLDEEEFEHPPPQVVEDDDNEQY
jgi:hypothetical protein